MKDKICINNYIIQKMKKMEHDKLEQKKYMKEFEKNKLNKFDKYYNDFMKYQKLRDERRNKDDIRMHRLQHRDRKENLNKYLNEQKRIKM